ncbi:MAG: hypothetical protein ACREQ9_02580, partial [Candidatus Binatia bacterium]
AFYYASEYVAVPGTKLVIRGEYPRARYASFNVYDALNRPLDGLADVNIQALPGSTNPFVVGNDRNASPREYEIEIRFEPKPASPAPNTIYAGEGQPVGANRPPNFSGLILYRIYLPDPGADDQGDVGLPRVSIVADAVDASVDLPGDEACAQFRELPASGLDAAARQADFPKELRPLLPRTPGQNPPVWHPFRAFNTALGQLFFENDLLAPIGGPEIARAIPPLGSGGFLSNIDNDYMYTAANLAYGDVLVIRGKAPTFPDTSTATTMPAGDVRYWSICSNDPYSTRFIACLFDADVELDADGSYTIVLSPQDVKPADATNWIAWGPQHSNAVIYRQMLPDSGSSQSLRTCLRSLPNENAQDPNVIDCMGDYAPTATYCSLADFEAGSCP